MISAVILTKNEEKNIVDALDSLSFCDEIIVIDDNSDDKTVDLAKRGKAKVFARDLARDFAAQRNFGLGKASHDWVLFIDADERVTPELSSEMMRVIAQGPHVNGFYVGRKDYLWGRELRFGEAGNIKLLRLARKGFGEWEGNVHESWHVKGPLGNLEHPLLHYPHPSVGEFLGEINFYTDLRSKELFDRGVHVHFWSIILYPKAKFFVNYFVKQGFRDGVPGLLSAMMMSFHSFLVRGKLWFLWEQNKSS